MDLSNEEPDFPDRGFLHHVIQLRDNLLFTNRRHFLILGVVFLLGNLVLPGRIHSDGPYSLGTLLALFLVGAITTQLGLVATYSSISLYRSYESLIVSILLILFVWSSYVLGLRLCDNSFPIEAALFMLCISFAAFIVAHLCLREIGLRSKVVICQRNEEFSDYQSRQPISIKFLMLSTAVVAISIFLIKFSLPVDNAIGWPPKLKMLIIGSGLMLGFSVALHFAILYVVLKDRFRWQGLFWLIVALGLIPLVFAFLLELLTRERVYSELLWTYSYFVGHTFFTLLCFVVVRRMGYRLKRITTAPM